MKKTAPFIIFVGIVLLCIGLFMRIPGKELTTNSFMGDEYSVIEEYVGGDAYNYIIGAALVGGEIAGAMTQKAIYIGIGLLIICIGLIVYAYGHSKSLEKETAQINALNEDLPEM